MNPYRQVVGHNGNLEWKQYGRAHCKSELCLVVGLLKTVRNNLFHGGKHGAEGWSDPQRTKELLVCGKEILDKIVEMAGWESDYTEYY